MNSHQAATSKDWLRLAASLLAIVGFLILAQLVSPAMPGPAGVMFEQNMSQDLEASALFYSEVTDIREFLDTEHGRYGINVRPKLKTDDE